ncbi:hypothetical protein QCA50_005488 [Cerrena zonata]|uniref:Microtubule associated protein n=1 Tax=Cerrena zonata TaxID=2478898 RepID=A0AAW0GQ80_9APHY
MSTTTITSLLNSLHSHLQSQTQLLPTLHAQLGLPATALADDLQTLQQQLTQCVEEQIDTRRKQVDEWMAKCGEVEEECVRYSKALGGHVKAAPGSVGEVRKEQVLPKRFEMITEFQEKLRQLYHTKLEQLLTITSRLATLSRTLGPDFFPSDILDPTPVAGEPDYDPDSNRDVSPERFSRLEKELVRGKGEVTKRLTQLSDTLVQIDWLHTELGIPHPPIDDLTSASSSTLGIPSFQRSTSSCSSRTSHSSSTSDPFLSSSTLATPTPQTRIKSVTPFLLTAASSLSEESPTVSEMEYERVFARFVLRLEELTDEEMAQSNTPIFGLEGIEPTPGLLSWAENKRSALEDIKRRRESHIQAMYDQLEALWRRLGVQDEDMDAFVESQRGSTDETIRAYEEELERMLELKREKMSTFVENARDEIRRLWDDLMVGEDEKADFAPFADDEHTEELLSIHEEEIRRLKEERKLKGPLLNSIKKYFEICEDQKELAAAAADQSRLLGRGPRDPGRLLREEKMRKRVQKEKPRLEQDLLISIPAWEAETGRTFLVHSQSILRILQETVGVVSEKENSTNANGRRSKPPSRGSSAPPRAKTPSYAPSTSHGHGTTRTRSNSKSDAVTPAIRPSSSMSRSASSTRIPSQRPASPSKIPGKTPTTSSLPRPVPLAMPVPKPGTQHHVLGAWTSAHYSIESSFT